MQKTILRRKDKAKREAAAKQQMKKTNKQKQQPLRI